MNVKSSDFRFRQHIKKNNLPFLIATQGLAVLYFYESSLGMSNRKLDKAPTPLEDVED